MGWMEYHLPHYQNSNMVLRFFFLKTTPDKRKKIQNTLTFIKKFENALLFGEGDAPSPMQRPQKGCVIPIVASTSGYIGDDAFPSHKKVVHF
jgi:hypothetical protein